MILPTTKTIARLPHLATFLADYSNAVVGWGRKPSGGRAHLLSRLLFRPLVLLEDGFIRSVERHAPPLSLLVDDLGVYYDASCPSRMETTIAGGASPEEAIRARRLILSWRDGAISKYNHAPDYGGSLPEKYVLVVDQTFGDLSVAAGMASAGSFATMLAAARAENPNAEIVVKIHPDTITHGKKGYFAPGSLSIPGVTVIDDDCHPKRLLRDAEVIYTVTSLMGFEALLWGKPVRCFGMPFYAGWGITRDALPPPHRRGPARIEDLVHAALVQVARYADPFSGQAWQVEQAIAHVACERAKNSASKRRHNVVAS